MASTRDSSLVKRSIDGETYREYEWNEYIKNNDGLLVSTGARIVYKIINPSMLYIRPGGSTHRVVDAEGVAHCVPAIGIMGCVIRWKNPKGEDPVNF